MSTASSSMSSALLKPSTTSPLRSAGQTSLPPLRLRLPPNSRCRSLVLCMSSHPSDGEPTQNTNTEATNNQPPIQPAAAAAAPSPSLPKAPTWIKWTVGSVVWLSLPAWRKVQTVQNVVAKVDTVVEIMETVVETTENVASQVAKDLPEGSSLKKAALGLEHASEEILKDVQVIDSVIDKVEELGEKLKTDEKKANSHEKHAEKAMAK